MSKCNCHIQWLYFLQLGYNMYSFIYSIIDNWRSDMIAEPWQMLNFYAGS